MKNKIIGLLVVIGLVVVVRRVIKMTKDVVKVYASFIDGEPVGI